MKKKSINDTFLTETSLFLLQVLLYSMKYGLEFCFLVVKVYINLHYLLFWACRPVHEGSDRNHSHENLLKKQCCCNITSSGSFKILRFHRDAMFQGYRLSSQ